MTVAEWFEQLKQMTLKRVVGKILLILLIVYISVGVVGVLGGH
jgi:hypothetical protein